MIFIFFISKDDSGLRKFADNWNKFRGGEITSMEYADQQYSPDVEIYINTGHCTFPRDGKFFGVKQARRLVEKLREHLRFLPFHDLEGAKPCRDQNLCHFSSTHQSLAGMRVITKVLINETEDKIALLTINREDVEIMAEKLIEFLNSFPSNAHAFVNEFFSKNVRLDVENEAGQRTLTFEELPAFFDGLQYPKNTFALTGNRQCVDRENECDFELTYEIGDKSKIFWVSLTPAQDKIQRGVIREQKWLYGN